MPLSLRFTQCTGFFCLAIIKGPPNDIYFIIEGPYDGYFTEKVSQAPETPMPVHFPVSFCAVNPLIPGL